MDEHQNGLKPEPRWVKILHLMFPKRIDAFADYEPVPPPQDQLAAETQKQKRSPLRMVEPPHSDGHAHIPADPSNVVPIDRNARKGPYGKRAK